MCCDARQVIKWRFEDIRDVRKQRYLLQERALELFSSDGNNHLFVFATRAKRDEICQQLVSRSSLNLDGSSVNSDFAIAKVRPFIAVPNILMSEQSERDTLLSSLTSIVTKSVTQRWEAGEISNFEYLMHLNTLAGRTFNALNQYPVFPWIIADYDSEGMSLTCCVGVNAAAELDLDDPCTFRDLGKPMGAQTPARAEAFRERFDTWVDVDGSTPAFHYGSAVHADTNLSHHRHTLLVGCNHVVVARAPGAVRIALHQAARRQIRSSGPHVPERQGGVALVFRTKQRRREGADPGVLLPARVPSQHQPLRLWTQAERRGVP